ncbi:NAD(P)-binding domain protein [Mycena indigotica]|uniref:NAD(P)-binding domain protein n=1 Tax=Mycena indigotica TaxID=2126181 RepID=A0A8H6W0I0_9AGAR|nr:NAD(P)-binding domain protein [Mycena indigotica]KAF7297108.1 NAD(P)-binding domain protein [Mycena indigotica]
MASQSASIALGPYSESYLKTFYRAQFRTTPKLPPPNTNLSGHVAIITGASGGLGLHAARHLLGLGLSHLIMAVRSRDKGHIAKVLLQAEFPHARIDVWSGLEMTDYGAIETFTKRVNQDLPRVDMVVLNAGVAGMKFRVGSTGHEEMVQVNFLSTVLLLILLLPVLSAKSKASATGKATHITMLGSALSYIAEIPKNMDAFILASLDTPKSFNQSRYSLSKFLLTLLFVRISQFISPDRDGIVLNLIEPGYCKGTELSRDARGGIKLLVKAFEGMFGRKPEDGAWMHVWAAAITGSETHGCYLQDWEIRPFPKVIHQKAGKDFTDLLWTQTMKELNFARVQDILEQFQTR